MSDQWAYEVEKALLDERDAHRITKQRTRRLARIVVWLGVLLAACIAALAWIVIRKAWPGT